MEFLDFRKLGEASIDTDVCIVGTGPAGLTIARELRSVACRVLMVETGDRQRTEAASALNEVENIGAPRQEDHARLRWRVFGGTTQIWNGRCVPLEAHDFEERSWVPQSGWPLKHVQLTPYFERAAAALGLHPTAYDGALDARLPERLPGLHREVLADEDNDVLQTFCWQYSVDAHDRSTAERCARSFERLAPENVRVLLNATATQIFTHPSGAVEGLEIKSLTGSVARIHTKLLVVCAGGIETPRLLLASRHTMAQGLGNQHDLVGRYLMDHPRCSLGRFEGANAERVRLPFMLQRLDADGSARLFLRGLALSAETQRRERLLNCAGWFDERHAVDDPWTALKRMRRREGPWRLRDLGSVLSQPMLAARQVKRRLVDGLPVIHKIDDISLLCDVEQTPDANSRITLSDRSDALGVPLARIDWRIGELEKRTLKRFGQLAIRTFERLGLPPPQLHDYVTAGEFDSAGFIDVAHPSGGTRMASDPQRGVVDEYCQVHGVDRLYIVGNSIFPTNGHANPTLTIVALAIRLADRMKAQHFERASSVDRARQPESELALT